MVGYGEVPVFPGLSAETIENVEDCLKGLKTGFDISSGGLISLPSSVQFGIEMALNDLYNGGSGLIFPSSYTQGETVIDINGLIWMGSLEEMKERIKEKINEDYRCIKVKIGAIEWEDEMRLLEYIRNNGRIDLILRVDANGALPEDDYMPYLKDLAHFEIHSIEQPIRQGQPYKMRELCEKSPVRVALDEELIGVPPGDERETLLETIKPDFIVIKPALCYGFKGSNDWIELAEAKGIGWWITSALESSIGLNAIAQFTGMKNTTVTQGLGTGSLYLNNLPSPLSLNRDCLFYSGQNVQQYKSSMESLPWR